MFLAQSPILHEGIKRRGRPRKNWTWLWEAWKYHNRGRRSWQWTESSGEDVLTDAQKCTGGTKV